MKRSVQEGIFLPLCQNGDWTPLVPNLSIEYNDYQPILVSAYISYTFHVRYICKTQTCARINARTYTPPMNAHERTQARVLRINSEGLESVWKHYVPFIYIKHRPWKYLNQTKRVRSECNTILFHNSHSFTLSTVKQKKTHPASLLK